MRSTFKVLFYLKRNKDKDQKVVPVMGRITVNGSIAQFSAKLSVSETLWEVSGGRAKGRSLEADRINRHLDNIRTQIGKHYQDICDRESYVTAEKVKNAYLGFGEKYRLLLEAFEKFTGDLKKRVGIDRCHGTWNRYYKSIDHLRTFMRKEYNVSDMPLAELEQSFIEQYHVYLKSDLGLKPTTVSGYLKCLKYVVKIAFNNGWMPRTPFSLYQYTAPNPERSFLTEDELRRMMTTELRYKRQDYNRDMFLFSCFTGICYADMASLTYDRIVCVVHPEQVPGPDRRRTCFCHVYTRFDRRQSEKHRPEVRHRQTTLVPSGKAHVRHDDLPVERRESGDAFEDAGT